MPNDRHLGDASRELLFRLKFLSCDDAARRCLGQLATPQPAACNGGSMSSAARPLAPSVVPLTLALIAASPAAFAIEPLDTFNVRIGGYISTFDTQVRADGETTAGTEFDLERDLDMDSDNTVAMVGLTW